MRGCVDLVYTVHVCSLHVCKVCLHLCGCVCIVQCVYVHVNTCVRLPNYLRVRASSSLRAKIGTSQEQ